MVLERIVQLLCVCYVSRFGHFAEEVLASLSVFTIILMSQEPPPMQDYTARNRFLRNVMDGH